MYDKGKPGLVTEFESLLVDRDTGDVYSRAVSSGFFIGLGGHGGPKGPKKPNMTPPKRAPDAVHSDHIRKAHALLYRLAGDFNPLHADPEVGRKAGFKGTILHGLCTYNHAAHAVLLCFGNSEPRNFVKFSARFSSPVIPGETLTHRMWKIGEKDGVQEILFTVDVNGRMVLSNGQAFIRKPSSQPKL